MKRIFTCLIALLCVITGMAQNNSKSMEKKVLVAYYSATGTTKAKAEALARAVDATLYEITPEAKYTPEDLDWRNKNSRSSKEMTNAESRPPLGGTRINANEYDVIFIGFPIWWDLCPRVVNTWIESQNLKGKTVFPFATSGSSDISNSQKDLRRLYPDVNWQEGKLLNGSEEEAASWIKSVR